MLDRTPGAAASDGAELVISISADVPRSRASGRGGGFDRRADHQRHVSRDHHVVLIDDQTCHRSQHRRPRPGVIANDGAVVAVDGDGVAVVETAGQGAKAFRGRPQVSRCAAIARSSS